MWIKKNYRDQKNGVVGKTTLDLVWLEPLPFEFFGLNFCGFWMTHPQTP
jgi:hypothetical protein